MNPFRYRGYYLDTETNLYYLQTRYYDSYVGRFINADGQLNGGLLGYNLFAYCENNPVMYVDPTGEFLLTALIIGAVIGATVAFAATVYADYQDDGEVFNGSISAADYAKNIVVGTVAGAAAGAVAPEIGAMLTGGMAAMAPVLAGEGAMVVVTITGTSVIVGGIVLSRIGKSGGYIFDHHYPDDHQPMHVHIQGDDGVTKVDLNGNPLKGNRPMTSGERKAFKKLYKIIWDTLNKWS